MHQQLRLSIILHTNIGIVKRREDQVSLLLINERMIMHVINSTTSHAPPSILNFIQAIHPYLFIDLTTFLCCLSSLRAA